MIGVVELLVNVLLRKTILLLLLLFSPPPCCCYYWYLVLFFVTPFVINFLNHLFIFIVVVVFLFSFFLAISSLSFLLPLVNGFSSIWINTDHNVTMSFFIRLHVPSYTVLNQLHRCWQTGDKSILKASLDKQCGRLEKKPKMNIQWSKTVSERKYCLFMVLVLKTVISKTWAINAVANESYAFEAKVVQGRYFLRKLSQIAFTFSSFEFTCIYFLFNSYVSMVFNYYHLRPRWKLLV